MKVFKSIHLQTITLSHIALQQQKRNLGIPGWDSAFLLCICSSANLVGCFCMQWKELGVSVAV